MELSQTQITDHSSERIEVEPDTPRPEWEDNLFCVIEAKDEQIKRLQMGNLCFMNRAKHLEAKVEDLKAALEEAYEQTATINKILSVIPIGFVSLEESRGVLTTLRFLADEAESSIKHDLAMVELPDVVNRESESED